MTRVLIGVQARSTSQRLPGKALIQLYNKNVLTWVLNACLDSANYLNSSSRNLNVDVAILCPSFDTIATTYRHLNIVEGSEKDVLSRYIKSQKQFDADYICRITGDCPFLTGFLISNHIFKAVDNRLDYLSNVDPNVRTELDGRDIEVLSRKCIDWLAANAKSAFEREHVTVKINETKTKELRRGHILNRLDLSDLKLSIDTKEDLEAAEKRMSSFFKKKMAAEKDVGSNNVFYV